MSLSCNYSYFAVASKLFQTFLLDSVRSGKEHRFNSNLIRLLRFLHQNKLPILLCRFTNCVTPVFVRVHLCSSILAMNKCLIKPDVDYWFVAFVTSDAVFILQTKPDRFIINWDIE